MEAFGKPVFSFQNTAFTLAECKTQATIGRVFVDWCIGQEIAGVLDAATASMAKWWCTERQARTIDDCLQLHAATDAWTSNPISRMFVDARMQSIYGGTNEVMKMMIARRCE